MKQPINWLQTFLTPFIVCLTLGGAVYTFVPNPIGFNLGIVLVIIGPFAGIALTAIRLKKHKGPVVFHPYKK
jgi:hypothetical protein